MFKLMGICRLVAKPELKEVGTTCVATFRVVTNEYRKGAEGAGITTPHFFECKLWDTGARRFFEKADKGDLIFIEAQPRQENWQDKDGNNRSKVIFRVSEFQVLPRASKKEEEVTPNAEVTV